MNNTLIELRTQLTQQLAKSIGRVWGFAPRQVNAVHEAKGFTIAELMIATSIFSIVLLAALAGFLQIGHLFYKGVSVTQTDTVANQVFADLTGNFQTATNVTSLQTANGYTYYCVGNNRYTFNIAQEVTSAAVSHASPSSGGNFGLLKDTLSGGSNACATPCNDLGGGSCPSGAVKFNSPTELLGDTMRLGAFSILPNSTISGNFYNVTITLAYGADDVLAYTTANDPSTVYCAGQGNGQQFCSVSHLSTGVYRGSL